MEICLYSKRVHLQGYGVEVWRSYARIAAKPDYNIIIIIVVVGRILLLFTDVSRVIVNFFRLLYYY